MINPNVGYLNKYGLPKNLLSDLLDKLKDEDICIFGATGALGQSFLRILVWFSIRPKKINLFIRKNSKAGDWINYAAENNVILEITFFEGDTLNISLENIGSNSTVLYFIGSAQPKIFMKDPLSLFEINVSLLSKVLQKFPKNIFYASTSEIYSGLKECATEISATFTTPQHPRGAYIESKRCGEAVIAHLGNERTKAVAFRVALATPPHHILGDSRVLSELVNMAKTNKIVALKGGWESVRQYQWGPVAIIKILWAGYFGSYNLYNICGGETITLELLAKHIAEKYFAKYEDTKNQIFANTGAPDYVIVSSERLNNEIGYEFPQEKISDLLKVYESQ